MGKPPPNQEDEDPTPYLFVSLEQKRIDQSKPYDSKKACWVPDEKDGFLLGEIKATKGDIVSVTIPGGEVWKNPRKIIIKICIFHYTSLSIVMQGEPVHILYERTLLVLVLIESK